MRDSCLNKSTSKVKLRLPGTMQRMLKHVYEKVRPSSQNSANSFLE